MFFKTALYLQIEYHWYCVNRLRRQKEKALSEAKMTIKNGKIALHRLSADSLSYKYEILVGIRDENGAFIKK